MEKRFGLLTALAALGFLLGDNLAWQRDASPSESRVREYRAADERAPAPSLVQAPPSVGSPPNEERIERRHPPDEAPAPSVAAPRLRPVVVEDHPKIARQISYYTRTGAGRDSMVVWLKRAGNYVMSIRGTLAKYGVPDELLAVAMVESGLQVAAVSPMGATGMWQFMPETARDYQLMVSDDLDERRDPGLATDAAARHLRDLFVSFNDWPLALAAYNAGENRIREVIEEVGSDDFWTMARRSRLLANETRHYVPKVLAVASILGSLPVHGFAPIVGDEPAGSIATLRLPGRVALGRVAAGLGIAAERLKALNPALVGAWTLGTKEGGSLRIPADRVRLAELLVLPAALAGVEDGPLLQRTSNLERGAVVPWVRTPCLIQPCAPKVDDGDWAEFLQAVEGETRRSYRVRQGDTPQKVADLFGVDAAQLMQENSVSDPRTVQVGRILLLPQAGSLRL